MERKTKVPMNITVQVTLLRDEVHHRATASADGVKDASVTTTSAVEAAADAVALLLYRCADDNSEQDVPVLG